jgi:BirA family biotin operon repressor/biotin-[acetyl-CoA-carboxylase] ligase
LCWRDSFIGATYDLARLKEGLAPFRLHWFPSLKSTSDHAAALRKRGRLFAPAIVLTSRQTSGRGRGANIWWSDRTVMTVTFALPAEEALPAGELPLIAGIAVRDAAAELTGCDEIGLKWPNDVLHRGRKLAGLLCERINKLDLIGLGMNINLDPSAAPAPLRKTVTSLLAIAGREMDFTQALIVIASHLRQNIRRRHRQPFAHFLSEYQKHHALLGKRVSIPGDRGSPALSGRVEGIDSQGRLLLRDRERLHHVVAGHVIPL